MYVQTSLVFAVTVHYHYVALDVLLVTPRTVLAIVADHVYIYCVYHLQVKRLPDNRHRTCYLFPQSMNNCLDLVYKKVDLGTRETHW
jgi:hypothetical protein